MTSVNSPACLLARNGFYRHLSPSPEPVRPVFSSETGCSTSHRERQVTVWVTLSTPPEFPGGVRTKGLWVSVILGFPASPRPSPAKPPNPTNQGVK